MPRSGRASAFVAIVVLAMMGTADKSVCPTWADAPPAAPFKLPPGWVAERVAAPPLVEHPVMAGFDDRGRLFVAEAAGVNQKADQLLKELPNSIRLLEDTKGDGKFDKSTVFADKMTFPMGVLWHDGALYTCSPPSVWKLEDTKGTGVADRRTELVSKFGFTGNAADVHGPFLGPDGRLYWCDGRHGHNIQTREGPQLQGKAARIFRCRPDGRDVEVVCGGGMDNPVEVAFAPTGEAFATTNILFPNPRRDAIIYCIEGGVYPYHPVVNEFKRTGDLLPPTADLGWVAPSGLMRCKSGQFGPGLDLLCAQFNTHKVVRVSLERDGGGFKSKIEDFLTSQDPDFHATDVLEDADGSILVVDTGGWFRIGCPTSQVAKPEIKGAIWRVRKADAAKVDDPWGVKLGLDEARKNPFVLTQYLADPRWAVQEKAIHLLAKKGKEAVPALLQAASPSPRPEKANGKPPDALPVLARQNAIWALTRIDDPDARQAVRASFYDVPEVRAAAIHSAGLHRDPDALPALKRFAAKFPAARRDAATALARIRNSEAVPALLDGLNSDNDRFTEHALIYALIEIADREQTLKGLQHPSPQVRKGALIALDQMQGGNLAPEAVVPLLDTKDLALQQTVLTTIIARPNWAPALVDFLKQTLPKGDLSPGQQDTLRSAIIAYAKDGPVQELVAGALHAEATPVSSRLLVLEAMAQAPLDKLPAPWLAELAKALEHKDERVARQAVATLRTRNLTSFDDALARLGKDTARPADLRVAALGVAAPRLPQVDGPVFAFLVGRLDPMLPPLTRLGAAEALGHAKLSDEQLQALTGKLAAAGPLEMPHLVAAFEKAKSADLGKNLLAALDQSPGLTSLTPDALRKAIQDFPGPVRDAAAPLFKKLSVDAEAMKAKLTELEPVLKGGDGKRGRDIFFGKKAACSACHLAGKEGGQIGPDMTKIGGIRTGRDLLEAIVFPSASFVRGFEPYVVATADGKVHTGILHRETADAIHLVAADRSEVRIPRKAIESFEPGRVSIMPQGLDAQLTRQELADLIAYMLSLK